MNGFAVLLNSKHLQTHLKTLEPYVLTHRSGDTYVLSYLAECGPQFLRLHLRKIGDAPELKVWVPIQHVLAVVEVGSKSTLGFSENQP